MPTWPTIPSGEGYPLVDTGTGEFVSSLVRSHLNATIQGLAAVPLVEDGTYPARPDLADAPVVVWIGDTNPAASMEDADIWVPLSGDAQLLDEAAAVALMEDSGSDLYAATVDAASPSRRVLSPSVFTAMFGSPALSVIGSATANSTIAWVFDDSVTEYIQAVFTAETGWASLEVAVYWFRVGGTAGNVRWTAQSFTLSESASVDQASSTVSSTTEAAAGQYELVETVFGPLSVTPGDLVRFNIGRLGGNAADTLTGDAAVAAVVVRKAS